MRDINNETTQRTELRGKCALTKAIISAIGDGDLRKTSVKETSRAWVSTKVEWEESLVTAGPEPLNWSVPYVKTDVSCPCTDDCFNQISTALVVGYLCMYNSVVTAI